MFQERRPLGVPTRYCPGGPAARISARTSSVGTPRSITHNAPRLAVLALDLAEEGPQRLAVGRIAGQDLVGERQAFGGDDEGDDELRAIGPLVAAVAVTAFGALGQVGGVDLEIGAGQIVEQDVEGRGGEIKPTFG
jgi:hypothetical protein